MSVLHVHGGTLRICCVAHSPTRLIVVTFWFEFGFSGDVLAGNSSVRGSPVDLHEHCQSINQSARVCVFKPISQLADN